MKLSKIYLIIIVTVVAAFAIVFNTFPRPTFSELEKRELTTFPEFSWESLADGSFTRNVSSWFSDSEPFRDVFMLLSMHINDLEKISTGEEDITFHASAPMPTEETTPMEDFDEEVIEENDTTDTYTPVCRGCQ